MSSLRLKIICNLVDYNSIVADIGTDHGIIPVELSKKSISKKIIATDISRNSLEKLEQKLLYNNNITNIDTRVSDGLDCLEEFEVDTIIISGMGGILIKEILEKNLHIAKTANYLILSPNNSLDVLRKFLFENNFVIDKESDAIENKKYYQIIKVKRGKDFYKSDLEFLYGKELIKNKSENLKNYLESELKKYSIIIEKIKTESTTNSRIIEINKLVESIRGILNGF